MSISILLVTDAPTVDPDDWMRRWAGALPDASMLMLGGPSRSDPAQWPDAIAREVAAAGGRTIVVARGRACAAARAAARRSGTSCDPAIAGAMFVVPLPADEALGTWPAHYGLPLAFPTVVVASRAAGAQEAGGALALALGSHCVDGGDIGSGGEDARLGDWSHGRHVLNWLIASTGEDVTSPISTACQGNVHAFARRAQ